MNNGANIIPTAEPFFFPGNEIGCLLVHGLTGSPKEMQELGRYLNKLGYTVIGIRLSGHATIPEDMTRVRWNDWMINLEDGWSFLKSYLNTKNKESKIFLAGLSLGGVLSLIFASTAYTVKFPIHGVISMSAPYAFKPDIRISAMGLLQHVLPVIPKDSKEILREESIPGHVSYSVIPTRGVVEIKKLLAELPRSLPTVLIPTLLLHARTDTDNKFLEPDSMLKIYQHLGTKEKLMYWVESGGHNMLIDVARYEVFRNIADFLSSCNLNT